MPYISVQTNQNVSDPKGFLKKLSAVSAETIGKSESFIQTSLEANAEMTFAGSDEPTAFIQCKSIGLTGSGTESITVAICSLCESELSIPGNRVYIEFAGAVGEMWGWNGSTL